MEDITRRSFIGLIAGTSALAFLAGCNANAASSSSSSASSASSSSAADGGDGTDGTNGTNDTNGTNGGDGTDGTESPAIRHARISVAEYGDIEVELNGIIAPITVANFAKLAEEGFYDGLTFHRIMKGFMIQGGDPRGNGTGGSDEKITGEFESNGHPNTISHVRGTISMARGSDYDSASSQFFICDADSTFLDGRYAGFGHVTSGMDVVDAIAAAAQPIDDNGTIPAEQQPVIEKIEMLD
jgi:peptidyl-prolyl cis-trans isomerase B (cyclophilin B)